MTLSTGSAFAEDADALSEARALYERGQRAYAAGDNNAAAIAFAKADAIVPAVAALEAALLSVVKTNNAVLGMELAERSLRVAERSRLRRLATTARKRFAERTGRVVVECADCTVQIDGGEAKSNANNWVMVGRHELVMRLGVGKESRSVKVGPNGALAIRPMFASAAEPTRDPEKTSPGGLDPTWFWVGVAATGASLVGTIVSGLDTVALHAEFSDTPTEDLAEAGEDAEIRTNVLLGVTGGLAAVTLLVGLVGVRWDADVQVARGVSMGVTAGGGLPGVRIDF